ncbi:hypothetical protein EDB85DRAFT_2162475 [Lactarius pseudohatsudake]|nr:hypothetical protein EDB85DRAFT_2162475 [Lactarius pseudohatsudake]
MAPSTRRSRMIAANIRVAISQTNGAPSENAIDSQSRADHTTSTQYAAVIQNNPNLSGICTTRGKHTFVSSDTATVPPPTPVPTEAPQGIPSKRARVTGPADVRPMPLQLPSNGETMAAPVSDGVVKGKGRVGLKRTSSFYPGRRDDTHPLASLQVDPGNQDSDPEDDIEDEDDWLEDKQTANIARKVSAKTSEVNITERPSWLGADVAPPRTTQTPNRNVLDIGTSGSAKDHGSAASTPRFGTLSELRTPTVELSGTATTSQTEATTGATWPTDTDLLPPGAKRLLLTNQDPLVRNVVQEAIENLRVSLLFDHAFPTAPIAFAFTKESLITAAEKFKPSATHIQRRLQQDEEYLSKIVPLVRARVVRARKRVTNKIAQVARLQTHNFNYTFPTKRGLLVRTPPRTHPYRNECIISAIRELFFTGGRTSFAARYDHLFPVHQGRDGIPAREVPAPMVALVATAMYATLHEWRTGVAQVTEFSANTYLDVYRSNTDTFNYILSSRPNAYHVMMADIYTQASSNSGVDDSPNIEIADLDLDILEDSD